jgi:hypothetical protein
MVSYIVVSVIVSFLTRILGSGITTSLISLIANAGQEDQAIATAGAQLSFRPVASLTSAHNHTVSYLFRSLGSVVGLSVGSTLVQGTLRSALYRKLSGTDVDEVCEFPSPSVMSPCLICFGD